jgi:hypothetical protein
MKSSFGDEYPVAITVDGVRMALDAERRWVRTYSSPDGKMHAEISRFMDRSASITFTEFAREWPTWSRRDRLDFCGGCSWLDQQSDFPDMLRYIMQHGSPGDWSAVAGRVGTVLPQEEAFDLLTRALRSTDLEDATNLSQGISLTRHPGAEGALRAHLASLWSHPSLWKDDEFTNWFAYGATCCIEHLIGIGAPPEDFAEQVRALSDHVCSGNRDSCRRFLAKHFPWLDDSGVGSLGASPP